MYQPVVDVIDGIDNTDDTSSPADCIVALHLLVLSKLSSSLTLLRHSSSRLYKSVTTTLTRFTHAVTIEEQYLHACPMPTHLRCSLPCLQCLPEVRQLSLSTEQGTSAQYMDIQDSALGPGDSSGHL